MRKGFTLVELLIVITIVMILSTLAINSYFQYRKIALTDLNADNLIAQINELRTKSLYRKDSAERLEMIKSEILGEDDSPAEDIDFKPKCYGVYFFKEGEIVKAKSFQQDFTNQKKFDVVKEKWLYIGCREFNPALLEFKEFQFDKELNIRGISDDNGGLEKVVIRFFPPKGAFETSKDLAVFESVFDENSSYKNLKFLLQYGEEADPRFQKTVNFNLLNGNVFKEIVKQ